MFNAVGVNFFHSCNFMFSFSSSSIASPFCSSLCFFASNGLLLVQRLAEVYLPYNCHQHFYSAACTNYCSIPITSVPTHVQLFPMNSAVFT
jgi:hypothetical protein